MKPTDRQLLESWVRAGTTPQRVVRRARIVLLAADGRASREIARRLHVSPHTVSHWRRQYQRYGPSALRRDAPGRGRKATVSERARAKLAALIDAPSALNTRWTIRRLAEATGISRATIHRVLRAARATKGDPGRRG